MDDSLSENQIEELLQIAESRLREHDQQALATESQKMAVFYPRTTKISNATRPFVSSNGQIARIDSSRVLDSHERQSANGLRRVEDPLLFKRRKIQEKQATAGVDWFNMPKTDLTPELKRDLQLLKMRNVLDPHRHYKKESAKATPPEFSQVGTLVEGPTEFFSGRMQNAQRKRTLVEEVLAGEQESGRFRKKYGDIQAAKTSGKRRHYKAQMAKKYGNGAKQSNR